MSALRMAGVVIILSVCAFAASFAGNWWANRVSQMEKKSEIVLRSPDGTKVLRIYAQDGDAGIMIVDEANLRSVAIANNRLWSGMYLTGNEKVVHSFPPIPSDQSKTLP